MKTEVLSTIVLELESGRRPKGGVTTDYGTIPSLGGEHLTNDGGFEFHNIKYVDEAFFKSMKKGRIQKNDILIVKDGATTGKISFVDDTFQFVMAAINEHVFSLRVNTQLADPKYVFLFLKSPQGQQQILKDFRGASIGGISRGFIDIVEIPLPPLDDQKRIAYLLSKVEGLIAQRKQQLQQLSDLLKSVFLDMFGDPSVNERQWETDILANVTREKVGYGIVQPGQPVDDGVPVIRVGDFVGIRISSTNITKVARDVSAKHKASLLKGDEILLACVGATIGKVALVDAYHRDHNIVRATARIRPSGRINRVFLAYFLLTDFAQRYYTRVTRAVGQPTLNIRQINELPVFVPPMPMQTKFAKCVEKTNSAKSDLERSLHNLRQIYCQISNQAFKGELDLSRIMVPDSFGVLAASETMEPIHETYSEEPLHLPEPTKYPLDESGRVNNETLHSWLNVYAQHKRPQPLSADEFLELVDQKLMDMAVDRYAEWVPRSVDKSAYEHVKTWMFQNLEGKQLHQQYDDAENQVRVSAVKD